MQIERLPGTCFVLRLLLGYPRPVCAQLLGIEESKGETLGPKPKYSLGSRDLLGSDVCFHRARLAAEMAGNALAQDHGRARSTAMVHASAP